MTVIDEIAAERRRQIEVEGWTPEHDDEWDGDEMAKAAACYALPQYSRPFWSMTDARNGAPPTLWPWLAKWWKPEDRRRDLVRAAALIVAEIERLDRSAGAGATSRHASRRSAPRPRA